MTPAVDRVVTLAGGTARARLVVDRFVRGRAFGGLRILEEEDWSDLPDCARAMTLKHGFLGFSLGGAKAQLALPRGASAALRAAALRELGAALRDVLIPGAWRPALDMGSRLEDIRLLLGGAGLGADLSSWKSRSHIYTAWSMDGATRAGLRSLGRPLRGTRFVVHGFGKVGQAYAAELVEQGATLIGVATRAGSLVNDAGLDLTALHSALASRGDQFPASFPTSFHHDPTAVLQAKASIVALCGRTLSPEVTGCSRFRPALVVCGANAALSAADAHSLHEGGTLVLPDFVANCGGVFGSFAEPYLDAPSIRLALGERLARRIGRLLDRCARQGTSLRELATLEAEARLDADDSASMPMRERLGRRLLPFLPERMRSRALASYCLP